jgi:single-strand DNA-binding protein
MASLNKVILLGNLTRDPELRYTPNGTAVSSFGLAVNRRYRQGDEWKEEVCFVDVVTYGRQAETVGEYLSKGSMALVEGRLQWRSWESDTGQKRSKHEVVAMNVQFMPRTRDEGAGRSEMAMPGGGEAEMDMPPPEDDDIPF